MQKVVLPRTIINTLMKLAQSSPEQEICGLICRNPSDQMQVIPVNNISENPQRFFQMDPAETIHAMKQIREQAAELFAIYHSHPHAPAYPSKTDIEQAGYPDALYLIISLNTKGVLELKGYKLRQDAVLAIDLII